MSQEVDISGMDYGPVLRERFMQQAAAIGLSIEELVQLGAKRRGRPAKEKDED